MANTPQSNQQAEFAKYTQAIRDLNAKVQRLDADAGYKDIEDVIKKMGSNLDTAKTTFKYLTSEVKDLENVFENISGTLKNVVADLDKSTKSTTLFRKGLNSVEGIARKLADHKSDENILSIQQLKTLDKQLGREIGILKEAQKRSIQEQKTLEKKIAIGKASGKAMEAELKYSKEIEDYQTEVGLALFQKQGYLRKIIVYSKEEVEIEKELQKTIGLTGLAFKGIAGTLQKIGVESESLEELNKKIRTTAKETGSAWRAAGTAIGGTFKLIGQSLMDPAVQLTLVTKLFKTLYDIGTEFSARTFEIQKALGLSTFAAKSMNEEFYSMQQSTSNIFANYKDLVKANFNLNEALGTSATFSADVLATQAKLMEVTGLTSEESAKIYEYSLLTGQSQEKIYDSMGKTNKGVLSNKKVMQEVLKTSGQLAAQYKNSPELLGKAVVQVQKLGISLEQAKNMASGLLNFEDSIASELEAELLTGQELNLEKARTLALQGKTAEAAAEMLKQTGGLAKFQSMNVLQQDALAKSMGMSTDELADSLVKAQKLEALGASEQALLKTKVQKLKDAGDYETASQLEKLALQGRGVKLAEQELDTQNKIDKSVSSIKESLKSGVAPFLGGITEKLAKVLADMAANPIMKGVLGALGILGAGAALAAAAAAAVMAIKNVLVGSAIDRKQLGELEQIKDNTSGKGGGKGVEDESSSTSSITDSLGGGKSAGMGKQLKTLFKNPKVLGRALKRSGGGSMLKGILKGGLKNIPMLGGLLGAGMEFAQGGFNMESAGRAALSGGGAFLGGLGGAAAGGALGLGTGGVGAAAIPALTGLGTAGGGMAGDALGNLIFGERAEPVEDFIIRPGQKPLKFRKDDIIMGGTNLTGNSNGGTGGAKVEALLQELIVAVKQSGNIHIGANKLNEAIGINLHPMR